MKSMKSRDASVRFFATVTVAGLISTAGWRLSIAQDALEGIPVPTSVNALMVALVDHAAHEIWEAGYADTLSGRDWQIVEQHAI